jgi:hypothetical protein
MRKASIVAVVLAGTAVAAPAGWAQARTRHDGTVKAVDPKTRTVVIDELGAGAREATLRVRLTPKARLVLSRRNPAATDTANEFVNTPIGLGDVKPGDFVVVDVAGHGGRAEAESLTVTLPAA